MNFLKAKSYKLKAAQGGFIALISTVILTAVLTAAIFATSTSSFFARFDALGNEFKRTSLGLSESCLNVALMNIAEDYDYAGDETVSIEGDKCYIEGVAYSNFENDESGNEKSKVATVKTWARFPEENGSWTTNQLKAKILNPEYSVPPPPTCSFVASSNDINLGQQVTLSWNIGGLATEFVIAKDSGGTLDDDWYEEADPEEGVGSTSDQPLESATYTASVTGPGGSSQCEEPQLVTVNPELACSEIVMMLDRTGSMSDTDRSNESIAAKGLLNLLKAIFSPPKVGVGRFGDGSDGGVEAEIQSRGQLSNTESPAPYGDDDSGNDTDNDLYDAVEEATSSASSVGTNLADAINVAVNEFAARGSDEKTHVLILVSDGDPTEPTGNIAQNSGKKSPAATVSPNQWTNPANAYTSNDSYATSATNGQQQGYGNFGFAVPTNANSITGILVEVEGKVSPPPPITTSTLFPNGQGNYTSWNGSESGIDETGSVSCSSGDRIDSNNNGNRESVNIDLSSVPNGSNVTSVQIFTWDQGNPGATYQTFMRVNGTNTDSGTNLSTTTSSGCVQRSQTINTNFIKSSGTDLEVGVLKIGNTEVRVGAIRATVTYTPPVSGSVGVSLSWNNGTNWTSSKSVALTATEAVLVPSGNSSSDTWSRSWTLANFNNGSFALRVQNNSSSGTTVSLDRVEVTVYYTVPSNPKDAATAAADGAKDDDIEIFTIHFGNAGSNNDNMHFLASLAEDSELDQFGGNITVISDDFGTGSTSGSVPGWTEVNSGAERRAAGSGNDTPSPDGGRFAVIFNGGSICRQVNATGLTGLNLSYYWRGDSDANSSSDDGIVEYRTGGSCTSSSGWSQLQNHDLQNDGSWSTQNPFALPAALNNNTFYIRFRANSGTNEYFRVDDVLLTATNSGTVNVEEENADEDHFFIAPTSADMPEIFDTIGKLACPAAAPPPAGEEPPVIPPAPPLLQTIDIASWEEIISVIE